MPAGLEWRPTAPLAALRARAELLARVRGFFAARQVLEVSTPVLIGAGLADRHIECFALADPPPGGPAYLHSSPEFAMKRLLAAGSGDIYQICPVFRAGERGARHNPEFTLLEWYRTGLDHHALMDEVEALLRELRPACPAARRLSYAEAFGHLLGIDPHAADGQGLMACARARGEVPRGLGAADRDAWLDWLLSTAVTPSFAADRPTFLYDYPASQCALARIQPGPPPTAARFELFWGELELANGYHELGDAAEQGARFARDSAARSGGGRSAPPADRRLLAALAAGLPDCAGVALGLDRLLMLITGAQRIEQVIAFPSERA